MSSGCPELSTPHAWTTRARAFARVVLSVCVGAMGLAGCAGSGQPPRGPAYTPVESAEAETRCVPEQAAAKSARERLLVAENLPDEGGDPVTAREAAARATLAHGECEARLVLARPVRAPRLELYLVTLGQGRQQLQIARNLLEETARYGMPPMNAIAMTALGELLASFASAASEGRPPDVDPVDLAGPIDALRGDARIALEQALRLSRGAVPGSPLAETSARACAAIRKLVPGTRCE